MTSPLPERLRELAERYEQEGERIARAALSPLGVSRDAATAADCFTIAAALRARAQSGGDHD